MENNYCVYIHISPNNKRYIGITGQNVKRRWENGRGYKNNVYFYRAIEKYGWDNFQHIIIAKGLTQNEAEWLEVELIREWDTTNKDKGYNISLGGNSGNKHTEETKRKIGEKSKGRNIGEKGYWFGKSLSEETRKKISESHKGKTLSDEHKEKISNSLSGENHWNFGNKKENTPMFGKNHSEETRKKISESHKGKTFSDEHKENLSKNHYDCNGTKNPSAILYNIYDENDIFVDCKCGTEIYEEFLKISYQSFQKIIDNNGIVDVNLFRKNSIKEKLIHYIGWKFKKLLVDKE